MPRRRTDPEPVARAFGDAVRRERTHRSLTIEQLGARMDQPDGKYLGEVERGFHSPTLMMAKRIADALEVPLHGRRKEGPMTRSRTALAFVGVVLVVALLGVAAAFGKAGGADRPFKFHATGTTVLNPATGQLTTEATGHGSHLGLYDETEHAQLVPIGPGVFSFNSTWTLTAANGDQMSGNCRGQSTTPDGGANVLTSLDCVVTGGTGRFDDGSGNLHAEVHATLVSVEAGQPHYATQVSGKGKISY